VVMNGSVTCGNQLGGDMWQIIVTYHTTRGDDVDYLLIVDSC
jgi:hypothetical protein